MKHVLHIAVLVLAMATMTACGDATPDSTNSGASANLSAGAVFDAAGTWKMESTTCASFPVPAQFQNMVQSLASNVQTFATDTTQAGGVIVSPSEGTLDTQSGAYVLCYTSTLAKCTVSCTGTVDGANRVSLACNNANDNSTCAIVLNKQ